jgi:hypothetical protein
MINNYNTEVLSEFYIIIFLNKLKILENTFPLKMKTSMAKAMGPFRYSQASSWVSGPRIDEPTEPPLIDPVGRGNRSTRRKPPICRKSLTN